MMVFETIMSGALYYADSSEGQASEITPYLVLTAKLMFMIAEKPLLWAGCKTVDVIPYLNVNAMVGRDLRARRKT